MDEDEFRATYYTVNKRRCIFEKTINSRRSTCTRSQRFNLADREGVACKSASANVACTLLLTQLRSNARFALHLTNADKPLPHAREIKVQTGGLLGLQGLLFPERSEHDKADDITHLVDIALERYKSFDKLPYDVINQAIVKFEGRRKNKRG